jgi:hypothetical protein
MFKKRFWGWACNHMHYGFPNPIPNLTTYFFSQDNLCHFEDNQHMMCKSVLKTIQMKSYLKLEVEVELMMNFSFKIYMTTNIYYDKVKFLKLVSTWPQSFWITFSHL